MPGTGADPGPSGLVRDGEFPDYGELYATYFLDPHGLMLEVVCHTAKET